MKTESASRENGFESVPRRSRNQRQGQPNDIIYKISLDDTQNIKCHHSMLKHFFLQNIPKLVVTTQGVIRTLRL
jgi:hypothetical protein